MPRTRIVAVFVLMCRLCIPDLDAFDKHRVWFGHREWSNSTSPLYGTRIPLRISSVPKAQTDLHRSLRKLKASISSTEGTHVLPINRPDQRVWRPVNGIRVEGSLRSRDRIGSRTIVGSYVALAEIVGLHTVGNTTAELPIDLIKIV